MKTQIIAFVSLVTFSASVFAQPKANQVTNLNIAFKSLREMSRLPILVAPPNTSFSESTEEIPEEVKQIFNQVQKFVFGNDKLITLRACDDCQAIAVANTMSIFLEPHFLRTLKAKFGTDSKNVIAFIIAHEISHFTYEYITISATHKLSPNGNIPLLTKSFLDFIDLAKFATSKPEEQQAEAKRYLAIAGKAHAEVDLLALITLKEMNIQASSAAIKFFQDEISRRTPEERAFTDFEVRLNTVTEQSAE